MKTFLFTLLGCVLFWHVQAAAQSTEEFKVKSVDSICLTVDEADRSVDFFRDVLDFRVTSDRIVEDSTAGIPSAEVVKSVRRVEMQLGDEKICLVDFLDTRGNPFPPDTRANDHWFQHLAIVVGDIERAYQKLRLHKVRHASSAPQTLPAWNKNAAGIQAFYFRDPDGHFLELIHFPKDKGAEKWQQPTDRLFLGIDHTAIVVADIDESLKFYRDQLGLRVAGTSENFGFEQEHLNGVFGAHLLIVGLRAENGPGIELLQYLSPTDGRRATKSIAPDDIAFWQINVAADGTVAKRIRDPDQHAIGINGAVENSLSGENP
jgi:catechol 2,3-dioxygenase-like lactoylglutathione lyase family enzyme